MRNKLLRSWFGFDQMLVITFSRMLKHTVENFRDGFGKLLSDKVFNKESAEQSNGWGIKMCTTKRFELVENIDWVFFF